MSMFLEGSTAGLQQEVLQPRPNPEPDYELDARAFERIAKVVSSYAGIRLSSAKREMVAGRLRKRARIAGLADVKSYCRFLFDEDGLAGELPHLIDAITTNKTDFFREPDHFEALAGVVVPSLLKAHKGANPLLKIWSAACASGPEPYTIAMVLADLAAARRFQFAILGTDICTEALEDGKRAVYGPDMVRPIPAAMQKRYLMRSRKLRGDFRIIPELRRHVRFAQLNLMDKQFPVDRDVDVIFLRNALIYFDSATQQSIVKRVVRHLRPGGFLFLGHSEGMVASCLQYRGISAAVFQRV